MKPHFALNCIVLRRKIIKLSGKRDYNNNNPSKNDKDSWEDSWDQDDHFQEQTGNNNDE